MADETKTEQELPDQNNEQATESGESSQPQEISSEIKKELPDQNDEQAKEPVEASQTQEINSERKAEKPAKTEGKDGQPKPEQFSGLNSVVTRNIFYRDGYRTLTRIAMIQAGVILMMIVALTVTITNSRPQDRFFATTSDGRLIRLMPLGRPNMNDSALVSWAARAATETMTFGFHDYKKKLQEASRNFTRRGWQSFSNALEESRLLKSVQSNQQVVTAAPQSAPIIVQKGVVQGVFTWVVELPLIVTYQSGSSSDSSVMNVRMVIVRTSTLDSPDGVGIQQWLAS